MDSTTRRHWINTYRQRARATRADLNKLDVPLNDQVAARVAQRLQMIIDLYDAGIAELERAELE